MASIFDRGLKGVHAPHRKNTMDSAVRDMPVPDKVAISMSQHMGPPCAPLVKAGDAVKVGQVIGSTDAFLSAPVHCGVSGTVKSIDTIIMPNGARSQAVIIETDKLQTLHESISKPDITDRAGFLAAVKNCGMVGLGGAGFPAHVKFAPRNLDEVDTLIVNAAECEPYITSDYRTMIERGDDIIEGIAAIMKWLELSRCVIGIEDNKPQAIEKMRGLVAGSAGIKGVTVQALEAKYPQGAEKVLIYETTGRVVPQGKLPADVGCIVSNVTTVASLAKYLRDGVPLTTKVVTVDGGAVARPQNVRVVIGTSIEEVFAFCGGYCKEPRKILMGGPMMGQAVYDLSYPVMKNCNALLAFDETQIEEYAESACIRCGRCVRSCPMNLMPLRIEDAFTKGDNDMLEAFHVTLCIECGCCAYACPARRHLVQTHRLAKQRLRAAAAEKKKREEEKQKGEASA